MDIKSIMEIDIDNLKEKQFKALKEFTLDKLYNAIELIKDNQFDKLKEQLTYSPAGDGYGTDSYHLNFSYLSEEQEYDLSDILDDLKHLNKVDD